MSTQWYGKLRERAVRAWRKERPERIARLLKQTALAHELREKLEEMFGNDLPIKTATDLLGRPIGTIEDLRFTLAEHSNRSRKCLMLLDVCSRCEAETGVVIDSLADLGQLFEGLEAKIGLGCTECVGLTDDDLKPPAYAKGTKSRGKPGT
ncbi:MAG: hypothetical protein M3362_14440 [Acidobacteriota bacterium]|nr:hypothetical protein [Acidobacteriota bacterium]